LITIKEAAAQPVLEVQPRPAQQRSAMFTYSANVVRTWMDRLGGSLSARPQWMLAAAASLLALISAALGYSWRRRKRKWWFRGRF